METFLTEDGKPPSKTLENHVGFESTLKQEIFLFPTWVPLSPMVENLAQGRQRNRIMSKVKLLTTKVLFYAHIDVLSSPDSDIKKSNLHPEKMNDPALEAGVPFDISQDLETLSPIHSLPSKDSSKEVQ